MDEKRIDDELTVKGPQSNSASPSGVLNPANSLQPGRVVADKFRVLSFLGQGAMGMVYKVEHVFLHNIGAMKTVSPASRQSLRRFQLEAQAANRLNHINLVKAMDFGQIDERQWYFVMEFVEGETLSDTLKRVGRLDVATALQIFIPISFAMGYAHDQGVIHRDIKPHNIVLVPGKTGDELIPKVVDFGIAKLDFGEGEDLTKTGEVFGTPLYMSPEQCTGVSVDNRSDIYSLGCVLFEVLTGTPPFRAASALQTMMLHRTQTMPTLKEASLGLDFPPAVEKVLQKMLAKEPADRYQYCADVAADLISIQQGNSQLVQTVHGRALPSAKAAAGKEPVDRSRTPRKPVGMLIGVLVVLVFSLAAFCLFLLNKHDERTAIVPPVSPVVQEQEQRDAEKKNRESDREFSEGTYDQLNNPAEMVKKEILENNFNHFYSILPLLDDYLKPLKQRDNIESLNFGGQKMLTDSCIQYFSHLPLKRLSLSDSQLDDRGLAEIAKIPSIKVLDISQTKVDELGLPSLSEMKQLDDLTVSGLHFKNNVAALAALCKLKHLKAFAAGRYLIERNQLQKIQGLPELAVLDVGANPMITDQDLPVLEKLPNLTSLKIFSTAITDAGMDTIARLKLQELDIGDTQISDAGLIKLVNMKDLRVLTIRHCLHISPAAVQEFVAKRPCQVITKKAKDDAQGKNAEVWAGDAL